MDFKKLANENHEYHYTTRTFSKHGVSAKIRRAQRLADRAAKREVARRDLKERLEE